MHEHEVLFSLSLSLSLPYCKSICLLLLLFVCLSIWFCSVRNELTAVMTMSIRLKSLLHKRREGGGDARDERKSLCTSLSHRHLASLFLHVSGVKHRAMPPALTTRDEQEHQVLNREKDLTAKPGSQSASLTEVCTFPLLP